MSADNGIYILKTRSYPVKEGNCYQRQGGYEYRVAHCQSIDNIDYSDLYMPLLFADSPVFDDKQAANEYADKMLEDMKKSKYFVLEYGISYIEKELEFPNMTSAAAKKALDCYKGCTPLDC